MNTVTFPGLGLEFHVTKTAFTVFDWPVRWYGLIIAVGFLLAVWFCTRNCHKYGISQEDLTDMLLFEVPLCIIGARLYYVIFYLDLYRTADGSVDWPATVRIWDGGLAIYGAILMAILVAVIFCRIKKIRFFALADAGVYGLLIGQMVGRWGNFVNVECFGTETTLPWRMGIIGTVDGVTRYMEVRPTFLYESLWNLAGLLLLALVVARHRRYDGEVFWGYIAWYGLGRAWIEGLRTDSLWFFGTGLRVSQVLALLSFLIAAAVLVAGRLRPHDPADLWVNIVAAKEGEGTDPQSPAPSEESGTESPVPSEKPAPSEESATETEEGSHDDT